MTTHSTLALNSDGILKLSGLVDHNGAYQNDATVTLEDFVDRSDGTTQVSGISYPLSLTYVGGSNGDYEATIPYNISGVVSNGKYVMTILAILASGARREWQETVRVLPAVK
jgi:hypothetical protein